MADTTYNPQQPSNLNSSGSTKTTRYFNNFFTPTYTVSSDVNDAIISYFQEQTGNIDSARLLSQTVIDTAQAQREDPMVVLDQFKELPQGQLNGMLALYLNTSRVNTSFLGIENAPKTNPLVNRLIVV